MPKLDIEAVCLLTLQTEKKGFGNKRCSQARKVATENWSYYRIQQVCAILCL